MYPREAIFRLAALAQSGVLDLRHQSVVEFPLAAVREAIAHAAATNGPFARTVLRI